uniref:Uncharacterized protein n=1 Tax=Ciona savignyi TaxID=51511 RepID=H2Z3K8_CIOSA
MQAVNRYNLSTSTSLINTASKPKVTLIPNPGHLTQQTYNCSGKMEKQPAYCQEVRCSVQNLAAGERINFLANFRLWTHSFNLKNANVSFVTGFSFTSKQSTLIINKDGIPHQDIHNETIITAKLFEAEVITPQPDLSLIIGLSV